VGGRGYGHAAGVVAEEGGGWGPAAAAAAAIDAAPFGGT